MNLSAHLSMGNLDNCFYHSGYHLKSFALWHEILASNAYVCFYTVLLGKIGVIAF